MNTKLAITILLAICLSACTVNLQDQLNDQHTQLLQIQKQLHQLDKTVAINQADAVNEQDKLRRDLQSLQGTLEESNYRQEQRHARLEKQLTGRLEQIENRHSALESQPQQPAAVIPQKNSAPVSDNTTTLDEQLYSLAYRLFEKELFKDARRAFEKLISAHPQSKLADNALFWIGMCFYKERKFEQAIATFDEVIKKFPSGNKVPDAYYYQALSFCEIQDPLTAQILLETLIQNYPSLQPAALARKKLNELQSKSP